MSILGLFEAFSIELDSLLSVNTLNHSRVAQEADSSERNVLSQEQLHLLTEGLFFAAYRAYENYMENVFILCVLGEPTSSGFTANSYLKAKDANHVRDLLKSGQQFLDWTSPNAVILRAETYLEDGKPFKDIMPAHLSDLKNLKTLRNHIAHNSLESRKGYSKLVSAFNNGILPLELPTPGSLLLQQSSPSKPSYYLIDFLSILRTVANQLSHFG